MAKLTVIYWRDIPAQVVAKAGRTKAKKELAPRFAKAIDRAAMRAGRGSSDAYLADWRREAVTVAGDDLQAAVEAEVLRLEENWNDELLIATAKNGGLLPGDDD